MLRNLSLRILRREIAVTVFTILFAFILTLTGEQSKGSSIRPLSLRFASASIKPVPWERGQYHGGSCHGIDSKYRTEASTRPTPLGRCIFPNTTLGNIILFAYQQRGRELRVSGSDKWISSDAFAVEAASENPAETTEEQLRLMVQTLLRERFTLQFHREMHEERGFALVNAGNGPKLKKAEGNEVQTGPIFLRKDGSQLIVTGEQVTVESLINFLSGDLQQPIQDETFLDGVYRIELHFTPTDANGNSADLNSAGPGLIGPSLFTAVQEQLGLRLEPRKVPVETLFIDHVEHPSEN